MRGTALPKTLKGSGVARKLLCEQRVEREQTEVGCRKAAGERQSVQRW